MTDLAYGPERGIVKFAMLEFIARVPYQAWERVGYLALARYRRRSALARRVFELVQGTRRGAGHQPWALPVPEGLPPRPRPPRPLPRPPLWPGPGPALCLPRVLA